MSNLETFDRLSLGSVYTDNDTITITPNYPGANIALDEYSRFKYGDLEIARRYGDMMARHLFLLHPELLEDSGLYVTSSAYKKVTPASSAMLPAFVHRMRQLAHEQDLPHSIEPFKIDRANLTDGDYAGMSVEDRLKIMQQNGLSIDPKYLIEGETVVALDDICVTGSHEKSIERALSKAAVSQVIYSYVLDVPSGVSNPTLEARINGTSAQSIDRIIELSQQRYFKPNARLVKYILSLPGEDIDYFVTEGSPGVVRAVLNGARMDGLYEMERYVSGYNRLANAEVLQGTLWVAAGNPLSSMEGETLAYHHDVRWTHPAPGVAMAPFRDEVALAVFEMTDQEVSPGQIEDVILIANKYGLIYCDEDGFWKTTPKGQTRL